MQSASAIRRRIRSITNTSLITKGMQMVAASKMRRAQEAALAGRPFVRLLYRMQRATTGRLAQYTHPLLELREVVKRAVILVSTDKGCAGRSIRIYFGWCHSSTLQPRCSSQSGKEVRNLLRARIVTLLSMRPELKKPGNARPHGFTRSCHRKKWLQ